MSEASHGARGRSPDQGDEFLDYLAEVEYVVEGAPTAFETAVLELTDALRGFRTFTCHFASIALQLAAGEPVSDALTTMFAVGPDLVRPTRSERIRKIFAQCEQLLAAAPEHFKPSLADLVFRIQDWTLAANSFLADCDRVAAGKIAAGFWLARKFDGEKRLIARYTEPLTSLSHDDWVVVSRQLCHRLAVLAAAIRSTSHVTLSDGTERKPLPDGLHPNNELWWGRNSLRLPPKHWQLMNYMWERSEATVDEVTAAVWGKQRIEAGTLRSHLSKLTTELVDHLPAFPWRLSLQTGRVVKTR